MIRLKIAAPLETWTAAISELLLNAFGMDFDVAGNHEFDREFPFLQRMVSGSCYGKPGFENPAFIARGPNALA